MKKFKWLYRYALLFLVGALDVTWLVLCHNKISSLEAYVQSMDFVRLALNSYNDSVAMLDRITYYEMLFDNGVKVGIVIAAMLAVLVAWHFFGDKLCDFAKRKIGKSGK